MKGQVALLLDGVNYLLGEGDIAFINAKQLHQFTSLTSKLVYYAYVFPMGSLQFSKEDITQTSILEPLFRQELCFPQTTSAPILPGILAEDLWIFLPITALKKPVCFWRLAISM